MQRPHLLYSSVGRHLDGFHCLALGNNDAINLGCKYLFGSLRSILVGADPEVELLDRIWSVCGLTMVGRPLQVLCGGGGVGGAVCSCLALNRTPLAADGSGKGQAQDTRKEAGVAVPESDSNGWYLSVWLGRPLWSK